MSLGGEGHRVRTQVPGKFKNTKRLTVFLCRNLCFVTYKREDLFNLFDGGENKEIVDIAVKVKEDKLSLNPLLLLSTWRDRTVVMTKLLELGADPKCKDGEGRTCLHLAANNDSSAAVEILMKEKVCLCRADSF